NGGNGGTVETSGPFLDVNGLRVSARAPQGAAGWWLIDPIAVTISTGASTGIGLPPNFTPVSPGANLQNADLQNALNTTTNVSVSTGPITLIPDQQGNITVNSLTAIEKTAGGDATLSLNAHNYIWI